MIPKIIHYCWFGGNSLPDDAKKCIESWKNFFPEYEIKEWNERNFDINCCNYVKEAYMAKKWAFVSDYARFWILYYEGGLYFDTDVEVIKDMSDIIAQGAFMGCEAGNKYTHDLTLGANPGLGLGAPSGLDLYKKILDYYQEIHFLNEENITETVVTHTSKILKSYGWIGNGKIEHVEGVSIYPPEYFCPMDYKTGKLEITFNTRSIHWYTATWQSSYSKVKTKLQHLLGPYLTSNIIGLKKKCREFIIENVKCIKK